MRKSIILLFIICALAPVCAGQLYEPITLEKLYLDGYFRPAGITRGQSMQDGLRYSVIERGTSLNSYDYESGSFLQTVFSTSGLLSDDRGIALRIDDYAFSQGETKLLVGVNQESIYRRSRIADYYIWYTDREELEPLSAHGRQRLPEFSPDGSMVAFVRDNNIFIRELLTGDEWAVTDDGAYNKIINGTADWVYEEEFGFTKGFFWSPDSRKIAYMKFDEEQVREFNMLLYGNLYPREHRFKYPKAGEQNALVSVHVFDIGSRQPTHIDTGDEGDIYLPGIKWTSDYGKLAVQRLNRHQNILEILLADAQTGQTNLLYAEHNLYYIDITDDLTFLENGRHFIISSEKSGYNHIYLYDMQGRQVRALTSGSWDVEKYLGTDEERGLVYFLGRVDFPMQNALYSVRLDGRGLNRLTKQPGIHNPSFGKGFHYFINEYSTVSSPPVHSLHQADGSLVKVLEDNQRLNDRLAAHGFFAPSFFSFTTSEGVDLNGMMILPPDFDPARSYPLLLNVYGGPGSQRAADRWNAVNGIWFQMLAQQGFIVAAVDNRGTGFRGERFRKMTYLELGKYETIDQIEAAKYLGGLAYVDHERVGVMGWSYGGYLAALCLAKGAEQFAAAIAVAPVTSWRFYDTIYTERYMRTPQENPSGYDDNSPINHVRDIRGRLLLVHGSADDNVHYQNTMEMANALIKEGIQFDLMIYPDDNHSIGGPLARMHLYTLMTDFLKRNLQQNNFDK